MLAGRRRKGEKYLTYLKYKKVTKIKYLFLGYKC